MTVELIPGRLVLNNPAVAASGTFGYGTERAVGDQTLQLGGIVCKGLTLEPRAGNPPPRIIETAAGALNSIGLANVGIESAIRDKAPGWTELNCPLIVNINGESVDDYTHLASRLVGVPGVAAIEVNVSCPNVGNGGMAFGRDPRSAAEVTSAVRAVTSAPLLVKLTPNTENIIAVAEAVVEAGAEALTVANTYLGMVLDVNTGAPALRYGTGGLSGPAIKPLTVRLVYDVARAVKVPILGCGGIMTGQDGVEYMLAGAAAVQVGTANLADPFATARIGREMENWRERRRIRSWSDVRSA